MYVSHKNTNLQNVPPTLCKFMSGHIFDIYFYFPRENFIFRLDVTPAARHLRTSLHAAATTAFVTLSLPAAATAGAAAAHNRRTPYSAAAIADAFANDNGETASATSPPWAPPVMAYRLGVARPFLMLKALFLTLP